VLPIVLEVGVVVENQELEDSLKRKGMYGNTKDNLLECFEASITSQGDGGTVGHIVAGLDPAKLQKSVDDSAVTDSFCMEGACSNALVGTMKSAG
jgi:hypothetical protein